MSDMTELRDRIARAIFNVRDDEFDLDEWADLDSADRERYVCDAQAIIDEFGMTEEKSLVLEEPPGMAYVPSVRIVGKWERPDQEPRP